MPVPASFTNLEWNKFDNNSDWLWLYNDQLQEIVGWIDKNGNLQGSLASGLAGGNLSVNGVLVPNPNFQNSATVTIAAVGGNVSLTATSASTPFSGITASTNTTAAMLVGSGASLGTTGSGTIAATSIGGISVSGTPGAGQGLIATSSSAATWQNLPFGAFSGLISGTNTTAAMVVGSGATLGTSGSGTIAATALNGVVVSGTPATGYLLTATSSSAASWQSPAGGGTSGPLGEPIIGSGGSVYSTPAYLDCSGFAGADDSLKIQACLVALAGLNSQAGIADARGLTGLTWSVDPFDAASLPTSGNLLLPPGDTVIQVPVKIKPYWVIKGVGGKSITGTAGSNLKAGASFPTTYSTGTVTVGTAGAADVITGSGTTWTQGTTISKGCAFVAGTAPNTTFGIITAIGSTTSITLGYGVNNGTGAASGSSYNIYCPVLATGTGGTTGAQFGMGLENLGLDCNNVAGCVSQINWYGQDFTYAHNVEWRNFTNIGLDVEYNAQNSGPWEGVAVPGSSCTSATLPFVFRTGATGAMKPLQNATASKGNCATLPAVLVDVQTDNFSIFNASLSSGTVGVSIGANTSCPVACPMPARLTNGVRVVNAYNLSSSGTTLVHISNAFGSPVGTVLENLAQTGITNILVDDANACTETNSNLGFYSVTSASTTLGIQYSSSPITSCAPTFGTVNTLTAGKINYATGGGTANAQTITLSPVLPSLVTGLEVRWLPAAANTTSTPTLNVNSTGAKTIVKAAGAALAASDLTTTAIAIAIYDGTKFELQNPQTVASGVPSFPETVTGTVNSGGIIYFSSTTQASSSSTLASGAIVVGGGTGTAPSTSANATLSGGALSLGSAGNAGSVILSGTTSGSTTLSVSATGGTLNLGSSNASVTSTGALTVTSCTGCGSGTPGGSNDAIQYNNSGNFAGLNSPTTNGFWLVGYNVTGGAAVAPVTALSGVPVNTPATPYTGIYSDRETVQRLAGGSTFSWTLPQVTGNTASNMPIAFINNNSDLLTLTANAVDKINGSGTGGTYTTLPNTFTFLYQDSTAAPGNWWPATFPQITAFPSCADSSGNHLNFTSAAGFTCGSTAIAPSFPLTVSGTVNSGGIPYFSSSTQESSSAALTANAVVIGGGAGSAPSTISASTTVTNALFATATAPAFRNIGTSDTSLFWYAAGGGTAQAQTVTLAPAATALTAGLQVNWLPTAANTAAAPTLNVNGLGAVTITKLGTTALVANDLTTTAIAVAIYDGTEFQLQNPQTASGSGSSALSAITAATTTNTIASGTHGGQVWNWALTSNSVVAMTFGETTAATSGTLGNQYILEATTAAGSTAVPLNINNSLTGSQTLPALHITPTWNTTGVVDAAVLINVTNTASGAGSLLFDAQVGGSSVASIDKSANLVLSGATAGYIQLGQGSDNSNGTTAAIIQAPTAVTSYRMQVPGAAPVNNNSAWLLSNATPSIGTFAKMPRIAVTSGSAYTNATTTFSSVVGSSGQTLSFAVEAITNYVMTCNILWSASVATAGPKFQITGPASPTAVQYSVMQAVTATTDGTAGATAFSTSLNGSGTTVVATTNEPATIYMGLVNGVNAGTITLQAAAQGVGTLTINPGSFCVCQ